MKSWPLLLGMCLLMSGCSHPTARKSSVQPEAQVALSRVYEYKGKGYQPLLNQDASKKVQWIEAGKLEQSTLGDSLRGGSSMSNTYAGGRIGLSDGAVLKLSSVSLTYGMGRDLESVVGS